ncbi:hypothetical protein O4H49_17460 [Kiloniella laminariae]|uniref:Uncharacterized protein n=2 Tax=Kiloniella laminariae TaxID=454162 RepID=A0ABT4LN58_9PROT|nr:hypothetical protein [Kiloniella laminariae]
MDVPFEFRRLLAGKNGLCLSVAFLLLVSFVGYPKVTFSDEITLEERQHLQAQQLREASKARAQSQLGYENIYRDPKDRQIDYYALTQQINILSNIVRALAEDQNSYSSTDGPTQSLPRALSVVRSPSGSEVESVYGPTGPNEKAVRLLLEYQLMVNGNPRLKVGEISNEEGFIVADVITVDGSLVERYRIDKTTGIWMPQ